MILVTTKMGEKVFKNCYHGYKDSVIYAQVKDPIPLKKTD